MASATTNSRPSDSTCHIHTDPEGSVLAMADPEVARILADETRRQADTIELIASENYVSHAVLEAQGSVLTNKYAV